MNYLGYSTGLLLSLSLFASLSCSRQSTKPDFYSQQSFSSRTTGMHTPANNAFVGAAHMYRGPSLPTLVVGEGSTSLPKYDAPAPPPYIVALIGSQPEYVSFDSDVSRNETREFFADTSVRFNDVDATIRHTMKRESETSFSARMLTIDGHEYDLDDGCLFTVEVQDGGSSIRQWPHPRFGFDLLPTQHVHDYDSARPLLDWWESSVKTYGIPRG